ncbi:MAG: Patatin, partial [Tardiphaga sp.]|nr:Patatin [Tardiphaga sp.]
ATLDFCALRYSTMADPHETTGKRALVLQGGGALGAYQVGAFEGLCARNFEPDWVAGISIGAINAALIAGNPPEKRHQRLDDFWTRASSQMAWPSIPWDTGDAANAALNELNASIIMAAGVPGFFKPRVPPSIFQRAGEPTTLSIYDTEPLRETLTEMVDFDLINHDSGIRLSVGAVDIETGSQRYFDSKRGFDGTPDIIGPEHIMASAALPPGFPAIKIGKSYYWDGGLTSNTPLEHVLRMKGDESLLIFQLDLFSAKGRLPTSVAEISEREKDIRFASRSAVNARKDRNLYNAGMDAGGAAMARSGTVTVIHLIYQSAVPEVASRDYNFSPLAIAEHRSAGQHDIDRAMRHPEWLLPSPDGEPMVEYVLASDDEAPKKRP